MLRLARLICCLVFVGSVSVHAQSGSAVPSPADFTKLLTFEGDNAAGAPAGWAANGSVHADAAVVHGGQWAVRLEAAPGESGGTVLMKAIPIECSGARVELRGFLRTESVTGFAGLWVREDGEAGGLALDMQGRRLDGTTDWARYSVSLPLDTKATKLVFGVLLSGTGKAWADDLELLVDGKPIWEAPHVERPKTPLDLDHQFDSGSGMAVPSLSPQQIENLATLGKVWGFLKYHHPLVTEGSRHWDYELFRVLPAVIAAPDRGAANARLLEWVNSLGPGAPPCTRCATLPERDLYLRPALEWLEDERLLGPELSRALRDIYRNRPAGVRQFYLSLALGVGNPSFDHELAYGSVRLPDPGYQLLSLFRFWNIIQYWAPYRDVIGVDWNSILTRFIPRLALANTRDAYQLELMALIATVNDTHANLWSSLDVRPPTGPCQLPVNIRFIEQNAVVAGAGEAAATTASGLQVGDVVTELDGKRIDDLVRQWRPYYAASNEPTRLRDIGRALTKGACGETTVAVRRDKQALVLRAARVTVPPAGTQASLTHDLPGPTFRRLSERVAYLKLSSIKNAEVAKYVEAAAGTDGLVIDIRNYPSEFVVFTLGSHLVLKAAEFARFTTADPANPGAFRWGPAVSLTPARTHYAGRVVVLVDEVSQSQAEYTTMAFRAAGALVIGSTTAGADGNVSAVPLPGGLRSMISGIGVFYPDKRPTQRLGIIADVEVHPSIAGIRAGRDEVLEEALRRILGPSTPAAEIERIVREARTVPSKPTTPLLGAR